MHTRYYKEYSYNLNRDMEFKVSSLHKDMKILLQAKADSKDFIDQNNSNGFENYKEYAKIIEELTKLD